MSKKIYLFSILLMALAFASCSETKEEDRYADWRKRNDAFLDSLANVYDTKPGHGGLSRFELTSAPGSYIYYKVKESAPAGNTESPKYTDYVKVYYKGTNILGEIFDGNFKGENPVEGEGDTGTGDTSPTVFGVNEQITGWAEMLQRMKVGDRWEIYIPWKYAYGSTDRSTLIPAYSNLIFDLKLLAFSGKKEDL